MNKIRVVINTETGKVQSIEQFVRSCSDVCILGEIDGNDPNYPQEEFDLSETSPLIQSVVQNLRVVEEKINNFSPSIRNIAHDLEHKTRRITGLEQRAQEVSVHENHILTRLVALEQARENQSTINSTLNNAWGELNEKLDQTIGGFDSKITKIADVLVDFDKKIRFIGEMSPPARRNGSKKQGPENLSKPKSKRGRPKNVKPAKPSKPKRGRPKKEVDYIVPVEEQVVRPKRGRPKKVVL